jgi:hypothetical protein
MRRFFQGVVVGIGLSAGAIGLYTHQPQWVIGIVAAGFASLLLATPDMS